MPHIDATSADTTWLPDATWATGATQVLDLRRHVSDAAADTAREATVSSRRRARTRLGKIKSCSCAIVNSTWHGFAQRVLQKKQLPCSSKHTASRGCGCRRSMCRPGVFATMNVFARPVFGKRLRLPRCRSEDVCLRPTRLREVSSPAYAWPDPSSGSVFARPRVFAMTRVLARLVFGKRLRPPTCLREDACIRSTCLRQLSSRAHMASLLEVRSRSVFGRPRVIAPRSVFAGNVSPDVHVSSLSWPGMCLLTPQSLRTPCFEASVLDPTCLQNVSSVFGQYAHPLRRRQCVYTYIYISVICVCKQNNTYIKKYLHLYKPTTTYCTLTNPEEFLRMEMRNLHHQQLMIQVLPDLLYKDSMPTMV